MKRFPQNGIIRHKRHIVSVDNARTSGVICSRKIYPQEYLPCAFSERGLYCKRLGRACIIHTTAVDDEQDHLHSFYRMLCP